jgi:hypothetical protein
MRFAEMGWVPNGSVVLAMLRGVLGEFAESAKAKLRLQMKLQGEVIVRPKLC